MGSIVSHIVVVLVNRELNDRSVGRKKPQKNLSKCSCRPGVITVIVVMICYYCVRHSFQDHHLINSIEIHYKSIYYLIVLLKLFIM